jgi:Family of unknown function (DUF6932)
VIPPFQSDGNLPPGVHAAIWEEIADRFGSTPQRQRLLAGLKTALDALRAAGCRRIYLDGSFVTAKRTPGDFDACWDVTGVDPALLDPVLLIFDQGRAAQKAKYGGELFPAQLPNGITGLTFLEFFQIDKQTGRPKGIVVIDLGEWPP